MNKPERPTLNGGESPFSLCWTSPAMTAPAFWRFNTAMAALDAADDIRRRGGRARVFFDPDATRPAFSQVSDSEIDSVLEVL